MCTSDSLCFLFKFKIVSKYGPGAVTQFAFSNKVVLIEPLFSILFHHFI